ncbi:hypothetical protein AVEN_12822-1 [Araneus ventricosus]|uniref:Uncharacterized protein n=1 Tax=Araneus ventricosus TaxID=182803 RepID=A0A4Y2ABZ5_ARAVE|nr:hypothetical protein AVEN_12822-1 [Araneus ventricosus]
MEQRNQERTRRQTVKQRLDDLFARIKAACPGVRVNRTLFDRRIKDLVGDQSRGDISLDAIPVPDSPEEALLKRRYILARDVALNAKRKSIMNRDISLAIGHLRAV